MRIIIPDFPFPPSSNATRGSFFDRDHVYFDKKKKKEVRGKMRHYRTGAANQYSKSVEAWAWMNFKPLKEATKILKQAIRGDKTFIRIDSYFCFPFDEVWTADGALRQMDASNRIKSLHDELAKLLQVDDRYFNVGAAEKCWEEPGKAGYVVLVMTLENIRHGAEVLHSLK